MSSIFEELRDHLRSGRSTGDKSEYPTNGGLTILSPDKCESFGVTAHLQ